MHYDYSIMQHLLDSRLSRVICHCLNIRIAEKRFW